MRKGFIFISLLTILMVTFTSVAYSYYNEPKNLIEEDSRYQQDDCSKTDETPWELLTKKIVGVVQAGN